VVKIGGKFLKTFFTRLKTFLFVENVGNKKMRAFEVQP
jgi:hypothetical protein